MEPPKSAFLVDTHWLARHLAHPQLRIVDATGMLGRSLTNQAKATCFDESHIPGVHFLDVADPQGRLSEAGAPYPWTWPQPATVQACLQALGVSASAMVVVYARSPRPGIDFGPMWCTRAWWVWHHYGVNCRVLDGGYDKWAAERRPLTRDPTEPNPGAAAPVPLSPDWARALVTRDEVLAHTQAPGAGCLVNALPAASFAGTDRVTYGPRKGHIQGAVNVPMTRLIDPANGCFRSVEDMRGVFERAGVAWDRPVITYCGGAIAATLDAFALRMCGHTRVRVYDGSLAEWSASPTLPMTDPSAPATG